MRDCGFQVGQRATSMAKRGGAGDGGSGGGGGGGGKKLVRPPRVGPCVLVYIHKVRVCFFVSAWTRARAPLLHPGIIFMRYITYSSK